MADKQWAFKKWKEGRWWRYNVLQGKKIESLRNYGINAIKKLERLANLLEERNDGIDEYKAQRDVLFRGFVGAQKLAVSEIRN